MRSHSLAALLGLAGLVAAVFVGAGREWGATALGVASALVLIVGVIGATAPPTPPGGSDGRP